MLGNCKNRLINELKREGTLKNKDVLRAFQTIDRADFVPKEYLSEAYVNSPLPIGHNQTISQPFTVAFMLELLEPKPGEKILDVGAGSGWTTALLASAVGPRGKVFGLEIIPELVAFGQKNIAKYKFNNASIGQAGEKLGLPEEAPYDKILVSAAGRTYPKELISQLKTGGIMVTPIKNSIWKIKKTSNEETKVEKFEGFAFVPLIED
ncbi:MAG: protein-L-isoaspartate(D-aspartate) O-methyltransferase [Candidatus Paceibacterota bacterium]